MSGFTQDGWADQLRIFRKHNANDDALRSFTLGAIRSLAVDGDIDDIRAALVALDDALADQS